MKNGANRTKEKKKREEEIIKLKKLAELSCQQKWMRSDRGQKRKPAQKSTKGKSAGGKSGKESSLKLNDVSTGLYKLIEIGRS